MQKNKKIVDSQTIMSFLRKNVCFKIISENKIKCDVDDSVESIKRLLFFYFNWIFFLSISVCCFEESITKMLYIDLNKKIDHNFFRGTQ